MYMNCELYVFDSLQHKREQKVQLGFDGRFNARPRPRYQDISNRLLSLHNLTLWLVLRAPRRDATQCVSEATGQATVQILSRACTAILV